VTKKFGTYKLTKSKELGCVKLTPTIYFTNVSEVVKCLASAPKIMLRPPMATQK
jgi:hypothetical protein